MWLHQEEGRKERAGREGRSLWSDRQTDTTNRPTNQRSEIHMNRLIKQQTRPKWPQILGGLMTGYKSGSQFPQTNNGMGAPLIPPYVTALECTNRTTGKGPRSDSHPRNFQFPGKLESLKLLYVRSRTSSDENPPNPRGRSHSRFMLQREGEGAHCTV